MKQLIFNSNGSFNNWPFAIIITIIFAIGIGLNSSSISKGLIALSFGLILSMFVKEGDDFRNDLDNL